MDAEPGKTKLRFYLPDNGDGEALRDRAAAYLRENPIGQFETVKVSDEGWADGWKKYYKPFRVGSKLVVKPEWERFEAAPGDVVITINPGNVFGTGLHQSTKLCLAALENAVKPGDCVIDIGCGSGILAIAAKLLGAGRTALIDRDAAARDTALDNAAMNGVDTREFFYCSGDVFDEKTLEKLCELQYDIIVANIVADAVINLLPVVKKLIKPGGVFIAGGIIKEREADAVLAARGAGFRVTGVSAMDEWIAVTAVLEV
jgi:ribosomal protein L11 methyltransferase